MSKQNIKYSEMPINYWKILEVDEKWETCLKNFIREEGVRKWWVQLQQWFLPGVAKLAEMVVEMGEEF